MKRTLLLLAGCFLALGAANPKPEYSLVIPRSWLVYRLHREQFYATVIITPDNEWGAGYMEGRQALYRELIAQLDALTPKAPSPSN